jgi:hypothetical protein
MAGERGEGSMKSYGFFSPDDHGRECRVIYHLTDTAARAMMAKLTTPPNETQANEFAVRITRVYQNGDVVTVDRSETIYEITTRILCDSFSDHD